MKNFLFVILISVLFSSCALFESSVKTNSEIKLIFCDSVKITGSIPRAIPNIPILDKLEVTWNEHKQSLYAHWCYSINAETSTIEKITAIIEKVTAIVERIIKIFYQLKT